MRDQMPSPGEGGAYGDLLGMIAEAMAITAKITNVINDLQKLEASVDRVMRSRLAPAVPIDASVFPDYLICLVDGARVTVLTRHLKKYGLTPETYRAVFGLPADYPMVPPLYSQERAEIARKSKMWTEVDHSTPRKRRKRADALAVNR